ncbi:MAG: hypothetical protein IJ113_07935 [Eggerthellaceae bacterium]|nr:hypothetical protein [Eggerthellaceae bacterium]
MKRRITFALHIPRYRLVADGELKAFKLRFGWRTSEAACDAFVKKQFAEREATRKTVEK